MKYNLHDGRKVSGRELIEIACDGREIIKRKKNDWIIVDSWCKGAQAREELWDLYNDLIKFNGKRIDITPIVSLYDEAEKLTDDGLPRSWNSKFIKSRKKQRTFQVDGKNMWLLRYV